MPREFIPRRPPKHPEIAPRLERLHRAIGEVLATAIRLEGSSFDAGYRTVLGLEGGFLVQNSVYGRASGFPAGSATRPIVKNEDQRADRTPDILLPTLPENDER